MQVKKCLRKCWGRCKKVCWGVREDVERGVEGVGGIV